MPKPNQTLTQAQIDAIAAGATLEAAAQLADAGATAAPETETSGGAAAQGADTQAGGAEGETDEQRVAREAQEAEAAAAAAATAATAAQGNEMLAFLRSELAARDQTIVDLRVAQTNLEARLASADATQSPLLAIARDSICKMQTALGVTGVSAETYASLPPQKLLEMHAEVQATFKSKFQVGGVAVTAPEDAANAAAKSNVTPLHAAQVRATRFNTKS